MSLCPTARINEYSLKIGDRVKFDYMGSSKEGIIIEAVEHLVSGQSHQSIKVKAGGFAMAVTINLTLFPHRARLIEEKVSE